MSQSTCIHGVKDIILSKVYREDGAIWRYLTIVDEDGYTTTITIFGSKGTDVHLTLEECSSKEV